MSISYERETDFSIGEYEGQRRQRANRASSAIIRPDGVIVPHRMLYMAEQSAPQFLDDPAIGAAPPASGPSMRAPRPAMTAEPRSRTLTRPQERTPTIWQTLDKPMLAIGGVLLAIGLMMVYSPPFDWAFSSTGDPARKVLEQARNVVIGMVLAAGVIAFDYRRLRRLSVFILLGTIAALVSVLLFGDDVF